MKQERAAIFNKHSGQFICFASIESVNNIDTDNFKYRIVDFDDDVERFTGTYETGSVKNLDDLPVVVSEEAIDTACSRAIDTVYPVYTQLNILTDIVTHLVKSSDVPEELLKPFEQMKQFIQSRRDLNKNYKAAYEQGDDWEYLSKEQGVKNLNAALEGGIHEEIGPREHVPSYMPCGLDGD